MHKFPEGTVTSAAIAIAALQAQQELLDQNEDCCDLWQGLSNSARLAAELPDPDWASIKALWLIADVCSMMLRGESASDPFKPFSVFPTRRSAIADDFSPDDAALFSEIATVVSHRSLRARLSDVAWLCARPKKRIADAHRAIDAYREVVPMEDNWHTSLQEWQRAISLCIQLGKGAGDRLTQIEQALEPIAQSAIPVEGGLGLQVARLLFDRLLAQARGDQYPELLAARGEALLKGADDFLGARAHLDLAARWFERIGKPARTADMTLRMALSWEAETDLRLARDEATGHLVASSFLEDAIQMLRKIPRDYRADRGVESHLHRLQKRLNESGEQALKAMHPIQTKGFDITEFIQRSQAAVTGLPMDQALLRFAHLHSGARYAALVQRAEESMRKHPLNALFAGSYYGRDGRVIAKTPATDLQGEANEHRVKVWATVMQNFQMDLELVCQAQIVPALSVIRSEHLIRKSDLAHFLSLSPIVPPGRAEQFAAGIWSGFEDDWSSAIYVLAPQVEHLVRWRLKQAGVKTTTLDGAGIENEIGLSSLIDVPEANALFGEDTTFELKALFCSAFGPNLRNEVAHGLLGARESRTYGVVYAWWWVLRLTLRSLLIAQQARAAAAVASAPASPPSAPAADGAID